MILNNLTNATHPGRPVVCSTVVDAGNDRHGYTRLRKLAKPNDDSTEKPNAKPPAQRNNDDATNDDEDFRATKIA